MPESPTSPARPPGPVPRASTKALVWITISLLTIVIVAGSGLLLLRSGILGGTPKSDHVAVAADDHAIVFLPQIEVEALTPRGHDWDITGGGPDIRYEIHWRGTRIFSSSVRKDSLLAIWGQDELGIKDVIHGVSAETLLKAARITIQPGEKLEFRVFDEDVLMDEEIGRWEVPVESLTTGDQTWNRPAPSIRQAVCRVIRVGQSGH